MNKISKKTPTTDALEGLLKEPYILMKYKQNMTEDSKRMYKSWKWFNHFLEL
jgi:hypothetical protein